MSLRLRKAPTDSGVAVVQIVTNCQGERISIDHVGSVHTPTQLAGFKGAGLEKINESTVQSRLDLKT